MKILILSSSFDIYKENEFGIRVAKKIDNKNNFLDNLKRLLNKRECCVIISGNPKKIRTEDSTKIIRESFEMSGIPFKKYIYVDDSNKHNICDYIKEADCIDLCGGHLPTCNKFINELNLSELLKDYNGVVIGSSGGAMNMAGTVYCIPEVEGEHIDKSFNRFLKGLNLTNINIIPHYSLFKNKVFNNGTRMLEDVLLQDSKKLSFIALMDGSYIIEENNKKKLYGEAYLLKQGEIIKINDNDAVTDL